jgi:predicted nucleotidyltransferase
VQATPFPDLNGLLEEFAARVRSELAEQVVGIYLQGSFALGAGDEWSDVDFIVATREPTTDLSGLNAMHAALFERRTGWAKHLEGSYIDVGLLREVDPERTPVPFLDNGSTRLVLDPHCNSAVVRWILRTHGVVLFGPPPRSLVGGVAPDDLRREAWDALAEYVEWGNGLVKMSRWAQPYLVLTICRLLRTIEFGDVTGKALAGEWAMNRLPDWKTVIRRALDDRPDPWTRVHQVTDASDVETTRAFLWDIDRRFLNAATKDLTPT